MTQLHSTLALVIAGMLADVHVERAATAVDSSLVIARFRDALLSEAKLPFTDSLGSALCFDCAFGYAKPFAALVIALAAALLVFGMRSGVASPALHD